jgi:3-deoxy-7-phosphoheptulonate synthase
MAAKQKHRRILGETIRSYRKTVGLSREKLTERADLRYGVSLTDSCINWETTERILRWGYDVLAKLA